MQHVTERPLVKKSSATSYRSIPIKKTNYLPIYLNNIAKNIQKLNNTSDSDEKQNILSDIKKLDEAYIQNLNRPITGHILLSRHGECNTFAQKKSGLYPNAGLSDDAKKNMRLTGTCTKGLLYNPNEPLEVAISPLLRALETAELILPNEQVKNITIDSALSENSNAPSGFDVRSTDDLNTVIKNTSWFSSEYILFNLSKWFYADAFLEINQKRQNALEALGVQNDQDVQALDFQKDKIGAILQTINTPKLNSDLWLIGHGKNFKSFYKHVFDMPSSFDFAETRRIYKLDKNCLFNPPYAFVINQKTGQIEGKFTGKLHLAAPSPKNLLTKKEAPNTRYQFAKSVLQIAFIFTFTFAGLVLGLVLSIANLGIAAPAVIVVCPTVGFALGLGLWTLIECLVEPKAAPKIPPQPMSQLLDSNTAPKIENRYRDSFQNNKFFQPQPNLIVSLEDSDSHESGMNPK